MDGINGMKIYINNNSNIYYYLYKSYLNCNSYYEHINLLLPF